MADILHVLFSAFSILSILAGLFFVLGGTLGVLRLPDFFTRLHAAGMTDTLGAELIILGLVIQAGFSQMSLKLLFVAFFLLITSPTATHAVAAAAYQAGLQPLLGRYRAPEPGEETKQ
ncbi:MAG: monovalent cation/H(+) antiporter subunit G [Hyphomonadaceae bacterium]|nr:monovalent cation/H(+) antiporter subunit G [Hyphomonadaceae bacterium]MBC6411525.1 monovalent cation/H(+) antiporter subunit G [Hyphomonadaceae bacterium]